MLTWFVVCALTVLWFLPSSPCLFRNFIHEMIVDFCQKPFLELLRWSCDLWPWVHLCDILHLLICPCWVISTTSLELSQLNHMNRLFDKILNLVYVYVHQGDWPIIFFICYVFIHFWYQGNAWFRKEFGGIPFYSILETVWEALGQNFLKDLVEFCSESIWAWPF